MKIILNPEEADATEETENGKVSIFKRGGLTFRVLFAGDASVAYRAKQMKIKAGKSDHTKADVEALNI